MAFPLTTVLSFLGAASGLTALGGFLHSLLSERVNILVEDWSHKRGFYNAFFKNQFKGCMSKLNGYVYIQISNNSKLPVCITNAKITHNGFAYDASSMPADHECKFLLDGRSNTYGRVLVDKSQLILPHQLQPFEYVEGFLFFHVFPTVETDKDALLKLEIETNRKKSFLHRR